MQSPPRSIAKTYHASDRCLGFTLIELLVVISIIALLIGILLPALGSARGEARSIKCASGMRQVAIAMNTYVVEEKDYFPPAYVYPNVAWNGNDNGGYRWNWRDQTGTNPSEGYVHWSYALFRGGSLGAEAFQCPQMEQGGMPATNSRVYDSFEGMSANGAPGVIDRQVDIVAFAANEMLIPRNKFFQPNASARANQLVRAGNVADMSNTNMVTEWIDNFGAVSDQGGTSKSHRSINPVQTVFDNTTPTTWRTNVKIVDVSAQQQNFGVIDYDQALGLTTYPNPPINAIGRHHPGGDGKLGGTTNFTAADGSTQRSTVVEATEEWIWGSKFHSLSGENDLFFSGRD